MGGAALRRKSSERFGSPWQLAQRAASPRRVLSKRSRGSKQPTTRLEITKELRSRFPRNCFPRRSMRFTSPHDSSDTWLRWGCARSAIPKDGGCRHRLPPCGTGCSWLLGLLRGNQHRKADLDGHVARESPSTPHCFRSIRGGEGSSG